MSVSVHKAAKGAASSPIVWSRAYGQSRPSTRADVPVLSSEAGEGSDGAANGERETERRVALAREQAFSEAQASQAKIEAQRIAPVLNNLQSIIRDLASQRESIRVAAEEDVVKLAVAIARRVLNRELATDPEAILGLVKAAFGKLNARETHRLRVAPSDAAILEENRSALELPSAVEIVRDGSLPPGSAVFETTRGELDASVNTQLAEIDRGLADVLRRKNK